MIPGEIKFPLNSKPEPMTVAIKAWRWHLSALAAGLVTVLLGWEWSQGGIISHHLLADPSMPAMPNAWGLLWLPLLAYL